MGSSLRHAGVLVGLAGMTLLCGCPLPPGDGGEGEGVEGVAAPPAKSIALDLIGVHDPGSDRYNDNCIACHGDRKDEVALDGVTPAAHATMLTLFGEGNERCIHCHQEGPNFITHSAGGLRAQVNKTEVACAACHGSQATPSFYDQ